MPVPFLLMWAPSWTWVLIANALLGVSQGLTWWASSVGVYRLWRDLGHAIGALLAGVTADVFGVPAAMWLVAGLTFASGVVVAVRMTETLRRG